MALSNDIELNAIEGKTVRSRTGVRETGVNRVNDEDTLALARAGKKQTLQRRFGFISVVGIACTLTNTWEGVLTTFLLGYQNGGPAGLIYGYFVAWIGTLCVFASLGELNSMTPTAGGQYHYVHVLAPPSTRKFLSYVTGWMTVAGWVTAVATASYFASSLIQGLLVLNHPSYAPTGWQGTLLYWAVVLLTLFVNTGLNRILPAIESFMLILHVLGFFAIIIPLLRLSPKTPSDQIWTVFNSSGWSTIGLAFFVGLEGVTAPFTGADGAIHMSEEIKGAPRTVPKAMVSAIMLNGIVGFGMLMSILYCQGDLATAGMSPTGYPFIAIFASGVSSIGGATAMTCIVLVLSWANAVGAFASASRMMWSFARDNGMPFSRGLSTVSTRSRLPMNAIYVVVVCAMLLGLINIGSSAVFNDVVSLALESFFTSYLIALVLLLWRRIRGDIIEDDEAPDAFDAETIQSEKQLRWGPWRIKGWFGILVNLIGVIYLTIMTFFCFWPAVLPVTPANMNYSVLIWGAVVIGSILYYIIWARKIYQGPIVEVGVFVAR